MEMIVRFGQWVADARLYHDYFVDAESLCRKE
jgi:hypothetical protein